MDLTYRKWHQRDITEHWRKPEDYRKMGWEPDSADRIAATARVLRALIGAYRALNETDRGGPFEEVIDAYVTIQDRPWDKEAVKHALDKVQW